MANPYEQVSRTAARALEDFSDAFATALALGDITPWATQYGYMHTTNALRTTWPIPLDAAGYKELSGDVIKYRSLYLREVRLVSKTWTDGVAELASVIEAPDFIGWADQPAVMADQWLRHPNKITAEMLAVGSYAGPLLDLYRDPDTGSASTRRLFAGDHEFNVLKPAVGAFDNQLTTTLAAIADGSFFDAMVNHFAGIKGANGDSLGLQLGSFLIPPTRRMAFKRALEPDTLIRAVTNQAGSENVAAGVEKNVHQGLDYVVADELKSQDYVYVMAAQKSGMYPWVLTTKGAPEEIRQDKEDALYKTSLRVGLAYIGEMNVGAVLPHPIVAVQITG